MEQLHSFNGSELYFSLVVGDQMIRAEGGNTADAMRTSQDFDNL